MKRWKWKKLKPRYEDLNKLYFIVSLAVFLNLSEFQLFWKIAIGLVTCFSLAGTDSIFLKLRIRDREAWCRYGYLIEEIRKHDN